MTIGKFRSLQKKYQRLSVLEWGTYLCSRETEDYSIFLFQLNCFYVEIYLHKYFDSDYLIRSFEDTDELDPYLIEINLETILN